MASYDLPRFDRDSGSRRTLDLMNHLLEAGWRITYVATSPAGDDGAKYRGALQRRGIAVYDGIEAGEQVIATGAFDLALFSFWQVAELFLPWVREISPSTAVVIDSVDIQLVRYIRRLKSLAPSGLVEVLDADDADEIRGEINTYLAADAVITVSEAEADLLTALTGRNDSVFAVPDQEDIDLRGPGYAARRGLVFLGSFRWAPNLDAATFMVQEVMPLIDPHLRAEHPLALVGHGLDASALEAIGCSSDVIPVGWVPSLLPYLESARAAVVPLRYGAGTKRKTIQSLAAGTPTIATAVGAEGLDLEHGRHLLVADDAPGLAAAIESVLTDEFLWQRLSVQGSKRMRETRSSDAARAALNRVLATLGGPKPRPRPVIAPQRDQRLACFTARVAYQGFQALLPAARALVDRLVPAGEPVLVVTEGRPGALRLGGALAQHFPQASDGSWTERPSTTAEVLADLERLASNGARHLLVPIWNRWFLEQFPDIEGGLRCVGEAEGAAALYLIASAAAVEPISRTVPATALRSQAKSSNAPSLIAFYLPQYHPIPENDTWWGSGFTDWRNVARADPLFPDHAQPHVPADLGFYDLRVPEVRESQAELARAYGITAFCYYHYWFGGKRLLERPFDEVLTSGKPDFPFTICWANEPWSRRWDGLDHELLQPQAYSAADDLDHIRALLPALGDHRAVKVDGRPLLTIYQAWSLPDPARTAATWKEEVERAGLGELYLCSVETGWDEDRDFTEAGFDAKIGFQPHFSILAKVPRLPVGPPSLRVFDYEVAWRAMAASNAVSYRRYETVCPTWDNTARRGAEGWVLHGSTPQSYGNWISGALDRAMAHPPEQRLVFVNAWNEWAEGCHLEPDRRNGTAYLEATSRALADLTARHDSLLAGTGR